MTQEQDNQEQEVTEPKKTRRAVRAPRGTAIAAASTEDAAGEGGSAAPEDRPAAPRKRRAPARKKAGAVGEAPDSAAPAGEETPPASPAEATPDAKPARRIARRTPRGSKSAGPADEAGTETIAADPAGSGAGEAPVIRGRKRAAAGSSAGENGGEVPATGEEAAETGTRRGRASGKRTTGNAEPVSDAAEGEEAAPAGPRRRASRKAVPAAVEEPEESAGKAGVSSVEPGAEPVGEVAGEPDMPAGNSAPAESSRHWEDDGVVKHVLPLLEDRDGLLPDGNGKRRRPRRRSHRKHRADGGQPAAFPPEISPDLYASSVLAAALPAGDRFPDADDFEDDGPQPMLPGQPSLALPAAALEEEDLDALDEQVNGNRIDSAPAAVGGRKGRGRDRRDSSREGRERAAQPFAAPRNEEDRPAAKPDRKSPAPGVDRAARSGGAEETGEPLSSGRRVLYVSVVPDEQVEVVITDNGMVTEYFVEMAHQAKIRGNIYKGVVNNVDTNLQAAFVNFGGGKNGFLQIDEVHPEYWLAPHDASKGPKYPPIQKVMKVGQEVLVQVVKEPAGTKGAFLTTWVSLAGRFLVLTPGQEQIGVSRKVEDPEERARLKELLAGIDPGEDMGVIIRTASEGAGKTSIQKDLQYLKRLWKDIRKRATTEKSPCLIYQEADLATRAVRDYLAEDIQEIWVDDENTLSAIRETTSLLFPRRPDMVKLHQDPRHTLWERFNLQRQLEEVTSREVILPSGGRLVFDQTEALMAIDINSGKTQGKTNFEAMVFRTNMEAAEAIARHLRLRDIGGQVVIDFIEMRDRNHCREVEKTMRNAMRMDRARHDVGRMSSFGLLELVRQRTGTSAISISSEPCPHCHGTGVRRNMEWQALHALRDLQAKLVKVGQENGRNRHDNGRTPLVHELDYELGLYLLNKKRDRLSELESRYGVKVEIRLKG